MFLFAAQIEIMVILYDYVSIGVTKSYFWQIDKPTGASPHWEIHILSYCHNIMVWYLLL